MKDDGIRGDPYEGVIEIKNYPPGSTYIPSIRHTMNYRNIHLPRFYSTTCGNIYSLFCVSSYHIPNPFEFKMDELIQNFGTYCLFVKDNPRFLNLMEQKLNSLNEKYHHGFVDYYDEKNANGKITVFQKRNKFRYQNEFRFYVDSDRTTAFDFEIGSLKDIAEIWTTEEIMTLQLISAGKR